MRRFVDLSIYLENEVVSDPPAMKPNIDYITHDLGARQMASFFPGLAPDELPDGEGWAIEFVQLYAQRYASRCPLSFSPHYERAGVWQGARDHHR